MKRGWQEKKLGDVCDFEGGSQPPKSEFIYDERPGYVRFLQIRDFGSDKNITYIQRSKKNRLCGETDILIGRYGASVGKILTGKAGSYNVALLKTLPDLKVLNHSWFYYFLISDEFQLPLLNVADRSAQAGFSKDDIYSFPVPVPPLAEQRRIVGLLDEAFEGIAIAKANAEKNLQNARAVFESHLQSVFTRRNPAWKMESLDNLTELARGYNPPKSKFSRAQKPGYVRFYQIRDGATDDYTVYVPDTPQLHKMNKDDIMMVAYRHVGRAFRGVEGAFNVALCKISNTRRDLLDDDYLFHMIPSPFIKGELLRRSERSLIPSMSIEHLRELRIPLPPLAEQQKIVKLINNLSIETQRLARIYERKLAALEALKKSVLHQAFTGEL